jgi:hypothetical protein
MAVTEFTDRTFFELTGNEKSSFSFLNLFNVLLDNDRDTKFMNIFRSYVLNEDVFSEIAFYNTYQVANGEYWDNVSFGLYETPFLWWMISILNNVVNPFEELSDGDILKVLKEEYVYTLSQDLEKIAED